MSSEGRPGGWDHARSSSGARPDSQRSGRQLGPEVGRRFRLRRTLLLTLAAALTVWLTASFMLSPPPATEADASGSGGAAATDPPSGASDPLLLATSGGEDPDATYAQPEAAPPLAPVPACEYGSQPALLGGLDEWRYTLLDTTYKLGPEYAPPELVDLSQVLAPVAPGQYVASGAHQLRPEAARALVGLFREAEAAGVRLAVQSAYRSYEYQSSTFDYWTEVDGYEAALLTSARAGHSEHQLGTSVDLRSRHGPPAWDLEDWAATPEGAWVEANAHRHGFVMSYPRGEEERSCYSYEPWHYRYVGPELATTIQATNGAPRLFLWRHAQTTMAPVPDTEETP